MSLGVVPESERPWSLLRHPVHSRTLGFGDPLRPFLTHLLLFTALVLSACASDVEPSVVTDAETVALDVADAGDLSVAPGVPDRCCPAGVCPFGEVCIEGACHPQPGQYGCFVDAACDAGQLCDGATVCTCEDESCQPATGTCRWPEGCCNSDADCDGTGVCASGVCRAKPEALACWHDGNCAAGQVCEDVQSCPCGQTDCEPTTGYCSLPGLCCLTDAECGEDGLCLESRCVSKPPTGSCYSDLDCAQNKVCAGAYLCPCNSATCIIPSTAGECRDPEDACCISGSDCPQPSLCLAGAACEPAPGGNMCYLDAHCGPGRVCEGATVCGCEELCPTGASVAGTCRTATTVCQNDDDCELGLKCAIPDPLWCPGKPNPVNGVCVEAIDSGCWTADDCKGDERCTGEVICTDPAGCSQPNVVGVCNPYPLAGDCCDSHLDCDVGMECRNSNTTVTCPPTGTAVCLPIPKYGEDCWNYLDCPAGQACNKSWICPCGGRCGKSHEGWCGSMDGQGCHANVDCGTGFTCSRDEECLLNPCYSTSECPTSGTCKTNISGQCWSNSSCPTGQYCEGLRVCPTDTTCNDPDEAGTCTPLKEIGECCDSYKACEAGARCVSAVTGTGCVLDVSSICAPYVQFNITCFSDDDCEPSRECIGPELCSCGLAGCDGPPVPGTCTLK